MRAERSLMPDGRVIGLRGTGPGLLRSAAKPDPDDPLWHDNLADGWRQSKATGLPMLIFISSESCIYCDAMQRETWGDTSVQSQLAGRFIPIHLKKGRNDSVLSRVKIKMYPTTLMATAKGKVTDYRAGYQPPDQILNLFRRRPVDLLRRADRVRPVPRRQSDRSLNERVRTHVVPHLRNPDA